jgi:hypothetical protein
VHNARASGKPMAPVAPAMNTRMIDSLVFQYFTSFWLLKISAVEA